MQPGTAAGFESDAQTDATTADLTIEQLAAAAGMSVRNVRNHHTRGLLPAPTVRARVGYYGPEHVSRLCVIRDLQAEGFNLAAIKRMLDASSGSVARLAGIRDAVLASFGSEPREVITAADVARRLDGLDEDVVASLRKLELVVPLGEGRFERTSPALVRAYEQVLALGVSARAAVGVAERLSEDCDSIARALVDLYVEALWQPYVDAGLADSGAEDAVKTLQALQALAAEAVLAMFRLRMDARMEAAADELLQDQVKRAELLRRRL
jgi:DNA-binding transcriptional MerR regulator